MANRRSSRDSGRSGNSSRGSSKKNSRMFHRGSEAIDRVEDELAQQKARKEQAMKKAGEPLRFFMKPGETKEIVVLDDKPDFFMYEHTIKDPRTGRYGLNLPCIKEYDNCPVCERMKESTYIMFLSVLDLTGYEDRKNVWHEFSRKLLPVKPSQQKKYIRRYQKEGTLRGAIFEVTRDGDMDANIGNDIEFIEFMDEEELINDYISEWTDRDNKKHVENHGEVIIYEDLFEEPTVESLRAIVGGEATPGSRDQVERDLDSRNDDGWEEDGNEEQEPWDEEEEDKPKRSARSSGRGSSSRSSKRNTTRRTSRQEEEREEDPEEDPEEEPRRGSKRRGGRTRNEPTSKPERSSSRRSRSSRRDR